MVKFTTLAAGGVDYYQKNKPASAKNGELWLPVTETTYDGTTATGVTKVWEHGHHSGSIRAIDVQGYSVYSCGNDSKLQIADANDGSSLTSVTLNNILTDIAVTDAIYISSTDNTTKSYEINIATRNWSKQYNSSPLYSVDEKNGIVIGGDNNGSVFARNADDGSLIWGQGLQRSASKSTSYSLYAEDDIGYTGGGYNPVAAFEMETGNRIWTNGNFSDAVRSLDVSGFLLAAVDDVGRVAVMDKDSGTEIWSKSRTNPHLVTHISNGVLYTGTSNSDLRAYDITDGTELWSRFANSNNNAVRAIEEQDGYLYVGDDSNTVTKWELDNINRVPANNRNGTLKIYYNGDWIDVKNRVQSTGQSAEESTEMTY